MERGVAAVLDRFLRGDPAERLAEAVGAARLEAVLAETWRRVGPYEGVVERPDGLWIRGTRGRVPVIAELDAEGHLAGLLISGRKHSRVREAIPPWTARAAWPAALAATGVTLWTADTAASWLSAAAVAAFLLVLAAGFGTPSATDYPRPARRGLAVLVAACAASAARLPGDRAGSAGGWTYAEWAAVALLAALAVDGRLRTPGPAVSRPLRLPLDPGVWYVGQGGGRWLNHHHAVPDQRAALDLVKLHPDGTRAPGLVPPRDPAAYAAYGTPLTSPCAGTVVAAVDGRPDQVPGRPRFAPPFGNFVAVDTGRERVLLAHLRPGSVRVRAGDEVAAGDLLGEVGNSGNSTEPHLHLQADRDGRGLRLVFTDAGPDGNRDAGPGGTPDGTPGGAPWRGRLWRGRRLRVGWPGPS